MDAPPPRNLSRPADGSPLNVGMRIVRRLFNLHGSAVGNAAASVRADDVARDARDSVAEAVALLVATSDSDRDPTNRERLQ